MQRRSFLHFLSCAGFLAQAGLKVEATPVTKQLYVYIIDPVLSYNADSVVVAENAEAASCLHPYSNFIFWNGEKWDLHFDEWCTGKPDWLIREYGDKEGAIKSGWFWSATSNLTTPSVERVKCCLGPAKATFKSNLTLTTSHVNTPRGHVPTELLVGALA